MDETRRTAGPQRHLPAAPRAWVERTVLMDRLDTAVALPLTLVVAPAGAGKTSSLAAWCRSRADAPVRWIATGSGLTPDRLARTLGPVSAEHPPVVVVDDAHLLSSQCLRLIDDRLTRHPMSMRLVLLCRWDPPIARLAPTLQGHLTAIRGNALQLSADETRELVRIHAGDLPDPVVEAVQEHTRGWAAVVAMAARTVAASPDPLAAARHLTQGSLGLVDLLASQVFSTLPSPARHLLLCVASEDSVTPEVAARLSGDPRAGELLAELETSGLLVSRDLDTADGDESAYRVHPLLTEVLRRRMLAGGVTVLQATAMVRKAARADVAQGDVAAAFRRLVFAAAWPDAVRVVADHGPDLLLSGHATLLTTVARAAPEIVEATPQVWLTLALDRWLRADFTGTAHWIDRVLDLEGHGVGAVRDHDLALLMLIRARTGRAPLDDALAFAREVIGSSAATSTSSAMTAWLLIELGAAENWVGDLDDAETHLRWAATAAEAAGSPMVATAHSHLAQTDYLRGRLHSAQVQAEEVLHPDTDDTRATSLTRARALVARALALPARDDGLDALEDTELTEPPSALADPTTTVLRLLYLSRRLRDDGALEEAETVLLPPPTLPRPAPRLQALLLMERAVLAAMRADDLTLGLLAEELRECGATAESIVVEAVRADQGREDRAAVELLEPVAAGHRSALLTRTRPVALLMLAQIVDARGDHRQAQELLRQVLHGTAVQRVVAPFLGWSTHGTPVRALLRTLTEREPNPWAHELLDEHTTGAVVDLIRSHSQNVGTPDVLPVLPSQRSAHVPRLTRRERDVLDLLARGDTYADIAETLFVTENTVKTHVSALYAKLGAGRRSEALKIARAARII